MRALALDLDAVLGDTRPLWQAWRDDASRKLRVEPGALEAEVANWPALLERFAEDHAAVYLRPDGEANAALRRLRAAGVRLGAFTEAPEPLARVAAAQLGVERQLEALEAGDGALPRLIERLGAETEVVRARDALLHLAS
jgi:phosphoglycolate phosphatase-like HAD superfamily hydrolase